MELETGVQLPSPTLMEFEKFIDKNDYARRNYKRVSETMEKLPVSNTIYDYFQDMCTRNPGYFEKIQKIVDTKFTTGMGGQKCVALIPYAAFGNQSVDSLPRTVINLLSQVGFASEELSILCFGNKPPFAEFDESIRFPNSFYGRVGGFLDDIPARKESSQPRLSLIRKILFDVALTGISTNGKEDKPPFFYLCDDDVVKVPNRLLQTFEKTFAEDSLIGMIVGPGNWDNLRYPTAAFPDFYVGCELMLRLGDFNRIIFEKVSDKDQLMTFVYSLAFTKPLVANLAIKPESYLASGGLDPEMYVNIWDSLVRQVVTTSIKKTGKPGIKFLPVNPDTTVYFDSRRAIKAYVEKNTPPVAQWRDAPPAVKDATRGTTNLPILGAIPITRLNSKGRAELRDRIQDQINKTLDEFTVPAIFENEFQEFTQSVFQNIFGQGSFQLDYTYKKGCSICIATITDFKSIFKKLIGIQKNVFGKSQIIRSSSNESICDGVLIRKRSTQKIPVFDRYSALEGNSQTDDRDKKPINYIPLPIYNYKP